VRGGVISGGSLSDWVVGSVPGGRRCLGREAGSGRLLGLVAQGVTASKGVRERVSE
jgi:hypothetical protein